MDALLTAVTWVAAGLLVVAGAGKLPVPDAAMATLHRLRLPSGRVAARVLGIGEVALGLAVIALGGRGSAGALAVAYAALLVVAARERSRQQDCGCFGTAALPVGRLHLGIDAAAALAGVAGLLVPPIPAVDVAAEVGVLGGLAGAVLLITATALVRAIAVRAGEDLRDRTTAPPGAATPADRSAAAGVAA
jgi:hypothetical protein